MKMRMNLLNSAAAALLCWAGATTDVSAQDSGRMLFFTGTTITHQGTNWAYLIWQATDETVMNDRVMAIFQKTGAPTSVADFSLAGMATLQNDPSAIQILLDRSVNLGEDLFALEDTIDQLFEGVVPAPDLPLRDKVSAVIRGAQQQPDLLDNLLFLAKTHPAIALCAGRAYATEIPAGKSTFEIREYNLSSGSADDVLGRVTVTAGAPVVLPAPISITEVPDASPMGDRNIRLRWEQPPALLRLSLLSFGFNIYRIPKTEAENYGFNTTPPTPAELVPPYFTQVNDVPILTDEEDSEGCFFVDDNDRFAQDGSALTNGDAFYYFVTARDILGCNGLVSTGLLVTVCDRMPPLIPSRISVEPVYTYSGTSTQTGFQISWRQNPDTPNDRTVGYYVYRARSIPDLQEGATNPAIHLISGLIPHVPGQTRTGFTDTNLPPVTNTATFWYTVRAIDDGACSANYSGQGAPSAGAVRDWTAAPAPTGVTIRLMGELATVTYSKDESIACDDSPLCNHFNLRCHIPVIPTPIAWVEFRGYRGSTTNEALASPIGPRLFLAEGQDWVDCPYTELGSSMTFFCRVGTKSGTVSKWARHVAEAPVKSTYREITFDAHVIYTALTPDDPTVQIVPNDGPTGLDWDWPTLVFTLPDGVAEWRIYRSVDGGEQTLIAQGLSSTNEVTEVVAEDKGAGIAYGATLCYYLQYFDVNGNPGPMTLIECIDVQGRLPKPMLMSLTSSGTAAVEPKMDMEWFCAPEGVERFNIWISANPDALAELSVDYCTRLEGTNLYPAIFSDGTTNEMNFVVFQTGRLGVNFGSTSNPLFTASANIRLGEEYTVFVRGVGVGNAQSPDSDVLQFSWYQPTIPGPQVPWPVREPVHVQTENYGSGFGAEFLDYPTVTVINEDRVGINIGAFHAYIVGKPGAETTIYNLDNLMDYIYTNAYPTTAGDTMFPFVIYRRQITNSLYSTVSGDLYQVSPLLESIYYESIPAATNLVVYDPYFLFVAAPFEEMDITIYALDTQPATRGAAYEYLLMRYNDQHEVDRIIPAGTVEIPE